MVLRLMFRRYQEWKNIPKTPYSEKKVNDKFRKGVIVDCKWKKGDFKWIIFTWGMKDGTLFKTILNLSIWMIMWDTSIYKMESLSDVLGSRFRIQYSKRNSFQK